MVTTSETFRSWFKASTNMKLSSDASVLRVSHEGITSYDTLVDFDKAAIKNIPRVCKGPIDAIAANIANNVQAESAVPGASIRSLSVQRLIIAANATQYYASIGRTMDASIMHYGNVLSTFKIKWEAYEAIMSEDDPKIPRIFDCDGDRRIIRWAPIFLENLDAIIGAKGPLRYVLRNEPIFPLEGNDPLDHNAYYGASGGLADELVDRIPHIGPIYKNDNASVYQKIEEAVRGTSVESTIKPFSRRKDGRGAFLALIANYSGDVKYRAIAKKRQNLIQKIKWTGNSYALETHVSNHRQAYDDLRECSTHINVPVTSDPQRVEYLINSITSKDITLQASIRLVRENTNNMRNNFEGAAIYSLR